MKLKQKIPLWAVRCVGWGAVFALTISCKREDPCGSSFCCGPPTQKLDYVKTVENMKADAWNGGLVLGDYDRSVPTFCFLQQNLYNGKLKISYIDGQPQSYKYRVWGTIYACSDCPTIAIGMSVLYIKIDKIEYQN